VVDRCRSKRRLPRRTLHIAAIEQPGSNRSLLAIPSAFATDRIDTIGGKGCERNGTKDRRCDERSQWDEFCGLDLPAKANAILTYAAKPVREWAQCRGTFRR
jgi:hypothetical protein